MRDTRSHTAFVKDVNLSPRKRIILSTNCDVHNEVFASLEYLSEIPEVGKEFITRHCSDGADIDFAYSLFQSFVRQAKTFYNSALSLDSHASPLNYYYSFLNLVKAYISLTEPDVVSKKIRHGLTHSFSDGDLKTQFVSVAPIEALFGRFYKKLFDVNPPSNLQLSIVNVLGYCTDIIHESTLVVLEYPRRLWPNSM